MKEQTPEEARLEKVKQALNDVGIDYKGEIPLLIDLLLKFADEVSASKDKEIEELKLKLQKAEKDAIYWIEKNDENVSINSVLQSQLQSKEEMLGKAVQAMIKIREMIWGDEYETDEQALNAIKNETRIFLSHFNQENNNQNSGK